VQKSTDSQCISTWTFHPKRFCSRVHPKGASRFAQMSSPSSPLGLQKVLALTPTCMPSGTSQRLRRLGLDTMPARWPADWGTPILQSLSGSIPMRSSKGTGSSRLRLEVLSHRHRNRSLGHPGALNDRSVREGKPIRQCLKSNAKKPVLQ